MAAPGGTGNSVVGASGLEARLREEPFAFEFFQAVRLLERLLPDRQPLGRFVPPSAEVVRIGDYPTLSFPASEIQSLTAPEGEQPHMAVNFMGMTGVQGALPQAYTSLIIERVRAGDTALHEFLNLFNHRATSLFYRAWEKYRFAVAYERDERDRFSHQLLDLIGLGTPGLQDRQSVDDDALIFYAGLLAQKPHSATALESILGDYFDVPVKVEQFLGRWYQLDPGTQCCMDDKETPSRQLGMGAIVGSEVWDPQSRGRIILGPLALSQYLEFLPSGSAYAPLRALTHFFSNDEFDFEAQLVLARDEVPPCGLGIEGEAAPHLGWVTWVKSNPMQRDPADTILPL